MLMETVRRSIHSRNNRAAFYIPAKFLEDWKIGDKIIVQVEKNRVYIKKFDGYMTKVLALSDGRRFITLPIEYEKVDGKFIDLKQIEGENLVLDFV